MSRIRHCYRDSHERGLIGLLALIIATVTPTFVPLSVAANDGPIRSEPLPEDETVLRETDRAAVSVFRRRNHVRVVLRNDVTRLSPARTKMLPTKSRDDAGQRSSNAYPLRC
jgi:hypothetical protein